MQKQKKSVPSGQEHASRTDLQAGKRSKDYQDGAISQAYRF